LPEAGLVRRRRCAIRRACENRCAQIHHIEARVKHDVIAFTMASVNPLRSAAARWLHYGMTSNDVVDTAQALQVPMPRN